MQNESNLWSFTGTSLEVEKYIWHASFYSLLLKTIKKYLPTLNWAEKKGKIM